MGKKHIEYSTRAMHDPCVPSRRRRISCLSGVLSRRRPGRFFIAVAVTACCLSAASTDASGTTPISVPATFVRMLTPPGSANHFVRPSALCVDRAHGEVYVADPGGNRIVIFGTDGTYRYEFGSQGRFSTPLDIAVGPDGFIFVLGSTRSGSKIGVFDFDGVYVRDLPMETAGRVRAIAAAPDGRIFGHDAAGIRIVSWDANGEPGPAFPLFADMTEDLRAEQTVGFLSIADDRLLVPAPVEGSVYVYSLDGKIERTVGYRGTNIGELAFPIDAAIAPDGTLLILDKHRFEVLCFDPSGAFIGEFGGKGSSPGWFYHPTLLDVDEAGLVYVGQVFLNRVQVCRVPEPLAARVAVRVAGASAMGSTAVARDGE